MSQSDCVESNGEAAPKTPKHRKHVDVHRRHGTSESTVQCVVFCFATSFSAVQYMTFCFCFKFASQELCEGRQHVHRAVFP
jgi:hypothetical protein